MALKKRKAVIFTLLIPLLLFLNSCRDTGTSFEEISEDTFWETTPPSSQQMDENKIEELESQLRENSGLYSFLIIRNGKIVSETYRNGASKNALLHIRSVTKSVSGLLTVISLYNGSLESTEQYITDFFPEIPENTDWENVKVDHLLNMTTGMNWIEERDLEEYEDNLGSPLSFIFPENLFTLRERITSIIPLQPIYCHTSSRELLICLPANLHKTIYGSR